jgi:chromate transporter
MMPPSPLRQRIAEVARLFLRLGATAFGGPAAHLAIMEDEVVTRRRWVSREEFLDLVGAANLIPGPNSTELAIHLGYRHAGPWGLVIAGLGFILPSTVLVVLIGWLYQRWGALPDAAAALSGIKVAVLLVVIQALWRLTRTALRSPSLIALAVVVAVGAVAGMQEVLLLFAAGLVQWSMHRGFRSRGPSTDPRVPMLLAAVPGGTSSIAVAAAASVTLPTVALSVPFSLAGLFWFFLKVGSVLFGSGYVLLAFLRADLVERWGWITEAQLLDAIAVGQMTPGPLLSTATFIGFLLGGFPGATLATVGIFLPAFVFVAASSPWVPRLRRSKQASAFLDGVNAASWALMATVTCQLADAALIDLPRVLLAGAVALVLFRWRWTSTWLMIACGLVGVLLAAWGWPPG